MKISKHQGGSTVPAADPAAPRGSKRLSAMPTAWVWWQLSLNMGFVPTWIAIWGIIWKIMINVYQCHWMSLDFRTLGYHIFRQTQSAHPSTFVGFEAVLASNSAKFAKVQVAADQNKQHQFTNFAAIYGKKCWTYFRSLGILSKIPTTFGLSCEKLSTGRTQPISAKPEINYIRWKSGHATHLVCQTQA